MIRFNREKFRRVLVERGGVFGWLVKKLKTGFAQREQHGSRLTLLDRISLAPRQSLVLIEAEGRRILVATSSDGGSAFFALDGEAHRASDRPHRFSTESKLTESSRVSW